MPTINIMIGIPGSGKSAFVEEYFGDRKDVKIFSSDKMRKELYGNENTQYKNSELFKEMRRRVKEAVNEGYDCVVDATNISIRNRKPWFDMFRKIPGVYFKAYVIETPMAKCLEQNNKREIHVPEYVLFNMYSRFEHPSFYEGWGAICFVDTVEHTMSEYMAKFEEEDTSNGNDGLKHA